AGAHRGCTGLCSRISARRTATPDSGKMRFKLDENLPRELADDLRRLGHDPDSIVEEGLSGAKDRTVLQAARTGCRVLLTLDKGIVSWLQHSVHDYSGLLLILP